MHTTSRPRVQGLLNMGRMLYDGVPYLDVQRDRSARNFGSFAARVRGEGRVWPAGR